MTYEPRRLNTANLDAAAKYYATQFTKPTRRLRPGGRYVSGEAFVMEDLYKLTFKDAFDFVVDRIEDYLDQDALEKFRKLAADRFEPRRDEVFEGLLLAKKAVNPAGEHVDGYIGTTEIGNRIVGRKDVEIPLYHYEPEPQGVMARLFGAEQRYIRVQHGARIRMVNEYWPVYEGEVQERERGNVRSDAAAGGPGSKGADPLPEGAWPFSLLPLEMQAANPKLSAEAAVAACDAIVDRLDEGSTAATIRGRTGSQPADPDATETGTLLFTLTMQATAFGSASDDGSGGLASAATITSDTSADASGTLTYCRAGATGTGADDHIDGTAGTSSVDFTFNTAAIVAGAAVTMSSFTVKVPQ